MARLTYTVTEAAEILGISRRHAYELIRRNKLPHIDLGRRIVVPKAALHELLRRAMPT